MNVAYRNLERKHIKVIISKRYDMKPENIYKFENIFAKIDNCIDHARSFSKT